MLKLTKETLTELTADQMSGVVGAIKVATSCTAMSCPTAIEIRTTSSPDSCVVASCITNE